MRSSRATQRLIHKPQNSDCNAPSASWWYIELKSRLRSLSDVRRRLRDQGATDIEVLSDRLLRFQSPARPALPPYIPCVVFSDPNPPPSAPPPRYQIGQMVRILSGPATGWVGRVTAIDSQQRAKIEILVWGKGMIVEASFDAIEPASSFPWESS